LRNGTAKSKEEVAKEILNYFLRHPETADNFLGIARWRLMQEEIHRSVATTAEAVRWLIAEGYLNRASTEGPDEIFQLNPEKIREAQAFIAGREEGQDPPES
jgi:hypothetical protein